MNISHGYSKTREYFIWVRMKQRCYNKKNLLYPKYGAIGIEVDKAWIDFEGFIDNMGICPPDKILGRIDRTKNYSKGNCLWIYRVQIKNITKQ